MLNGSRRHPLGDDKTSEASPSGMLRPCGPQHDAKHAVTQSVNKSRRHPLGDDKTSEASPIRDASALQRELFWPSP